MSSYHKKISVWVTTFNHVRYIREALDSIINQTVAPYEILVSDDGSTDGTQEIIREYNDAHPKLIKGFYRQKPLGITKNKNFIAAQACGELVTWLDGDDRFRPRKLEEELRTLESFPQARAVFSNVALIDSQGIVIGDFISVENAGEFFMDQTGARVSRMLYPEILYIRSPLANFRNELVYRDCLQAIGGFDERISLWQDWDLRIRLTKGFPVAYCPLLLQDYRMHDEASSRSSHRDHVADLTYIYEKYAADIARLDTASKRKAREHIFFFSWHHLKKSYNSKETTHGVSAWRYFGMQLLRIYYYRYYFAFVRAMRVFTRKSEI